MTPEEINIAIEKVRGRLPCDKWEHFMPMMQMKGNCGHEQCYPANNPTNYHDSLDAMHEAEKFLVGYPAKDWDRYILNLHKITQTKGDGSLASIAAITHATAEQRAEAFLYVFSKWKE